MRTALSTPEDWDAGLVDDGADLAAFDPEDTADTDGAEVDLDDIADPLPEDGGQDIVERSVEERLPWQDYNAPPLD
jgi:hypothetical protein